MRKVFIWGAGTYADVVYQSLIKDRCELLNIIDSNERRHQTIWKDHIKITAPEILLSAEYDYVIVSPKISGSIVKQCLSMGIDKKKIIDFWDGDYTYDFIDNNRKNISHLEDEVKKYKLRWENAPYELGIELTPSIKSAAELIDYLIKENASLCRFGDGEFEIMCGRERPWFQSADKELGERLREIIKSKDKNIAIAIADDFGNLDCYTEEAADAIRRYMQKNIRNTVMEYIDLNRTYYDAYISRPYILYKDKNNAKVKFELVKKLWDGKKVLLIESTYARMGVGNDLLSNVKSLKRIICPHKEAFDKYDEILKIAKRQLMDTGADLILISLGPTATVLAYDLAKSGAAALDIGQIDNEYEWYLRKAEKRIPIPNKMTAEYDGLSEIEDEKNELYNRQIVYIVR